MVDSPNSTPSREGTKMQSEALAALHLRGLALKCPPSALPLHYLDNSKAIDTQMVASGSREITMPRGYVGEPAFSGAAIIPHLSKKIDHQYTPNV